MSRLTRREADIASALMGERRAALAHLQAKLAEMDRFGSGVNEDSYCGYADAIEHLRAYWQGNMYPGMTNDDEPRFPPAPA